MGAVGAPCAACLVFHVAVWPCEESFQPGVTGEDPQPIRFRDPAERSSKSSMCCGHQENWV